MKLRFIKLSRPLMTATTRKVKKIQFRHTEPDVCHDNGQEMVLCSRIMLCQINI